MILFVDACVRENSRTRALADAVLDALEGEKEVLCLYPDGPNGLDAERLAQRDALLADKDYNHPMFRYARQFAAADTVVLAAPYWDLAFPAKVRAYLEEISVTGITFKYGSNGAPQGLCKAKRLIYVTTAGGPIFLNHGYDYVKSLCQAMYGIGEICLVKAEGLDIWGADTETILEKAKAEIPAILMNAACDKK